MKYKLFVTLFIVITLLVGLSYVGYAGSSAGTSGIRYRHEKLVDPYTRAKYFGLNYTKPLFGYGKRDAESVKGKSNFGRKGAGGVRNKLYNSFISQGRNPGRVSQFDSGYKGSKNIDKIITLKSSLQTIRDGKTFETSGFARLLSQEYEQNARLPFGEIHIAVQNAPPSNKSEMMGAWLVDDDTGYVLRLGNFFVDLRGGGSFMYRVYQYFGPYDTLLLTREPLIPEDPFPHDTLLVGDIK